MVVVAPLQVAAADAIGWRHDYHTRVAPVEQRQDRPKITAEQGIPLTKTSDKKIRRRNMGVADELPDRQLRVLALRLSISNSCSARRSCDPLLAQRLFKATCSGDTGR